MRWRLRDSPYTFTYTVTVSEQEGTYNFSGMIEDVRQGQEAESLPIGGDTEVMVTASDMPMASREFSPSTVTAGESEAVTVTITASGYGARWDR